MTRKKAKAKPIHFLGSGLANCGLSVFNNGIHHQYLRRFNYYPTTQRWYDSRTNAKGRGWLSFVDAVQRGGTAMLAADELVCRDGAWWAVPPVQVRYADPDEDVEYEEVYLTTNQEGVKA